jgi:ABC-type lipoprotein export system ATPase subunit
VTLQASSEILVLVGASSSGKSTILNLIRGKEKPTAGKVAISAHSSVATPKPIYLVHKPDDRYNDRTTLEVLLQRLACQKLIDDNDENLADGIIRRFASLLELNLDKKPSELSPSETYCYGIARASIESSLSAVQSTMMDNDVCLLPAPVLLLDEWMDKETSQVVHRVEEGLMRLVASCGCLVCIVTHKPNLLKQKHRCITLCRGEILREETHGVSS